MINNVFLIGKKGREGAWLDDYAEICRIDRRIAGDRFAGVNGRSSVCEKRESILKRRRRNTVLCSPAGAQSQNQQKRIRSGCFFRSIFDSLSKNLMFTHIFDQLQRELSRRSYDIMIVYDHDPEMKSNTFERVIRSGKVDGLINFRPQLCSAKLIWSRNFGFRLSRCIAPCRKARCCISWWLMKKTQAFRLGRIWGGQDVRYVYMAGWTTSRRSEARVCMAI